MVNPGWCGLTGFNARGTVYYSDTQADEQWLPFLISHQSEDKKYHVHGPNLRLLITWSGRTAAWRLTETITHHFVCSLLLVFAPWACHGWTTPEGDRRWLLLHCDTHRLGVGCAQQILISAAQHSTRLLNMDNALNWSNLLVLNQAVWVDETLAFVAADKVTRGND